MTSPSLSWCLNELVVDSAKVFYHICFYKPFSVVVDDLAFGIVKALQYRRYHAYCILVVWEWPLSFDIISYQAVAIIVTSNKVVYCV